MPDGQPDPQTVTANCSIGGKKKKKRKLNSKQSTACISSGPAALCKCFSVPCIIYHPSLQIPRSSRYNDRMQIWNCLWRVNLCECGAYRCRGGAKAGAENCLVEST